MRQDAVWRTGCALAVGGMLALAGGRGARAAAHSSAHSPAAHSPAAHSPAAHVGSTHASPVQRAPGYLGIEFHDLTAEQAAALHLRGPSGVEVVLVDHDGPAAEAGLQPHDLITGLNGHIVASGEALRRMIRDTGAGVEVRLSVFRDGRPVTIRTKLANREVVERRAFARAMAPAPDGLEDFGDSPGDSQPAPAKSQNFLSSMLHAAPFTGLVVEAMQPQLASYFGAPRGMGLLVQGVDVGSPAANAGLRAGDVILRMNGETLSSTAEWNKRLYADRGHAMSLTVLRDHRVLTMRMQPDPKRRSAVERLGLSGVKTGPAFCG